MRGVVLSVLLVVGCVVEEEGPRRSPEPPMCIGATCDGRCLQPNGDYEVALVELEGDCGPQDPAVHTFVDPCESSGVGEMCAGSRVCSADRCSIAVDARCPLDDVYDVQTQMTISVGEGADRLTGEMGICVIEYLSGETYCCSRYGAVWTRL